MLAVLTSVGVFVPSGASAAPAVRLSGLAAPLLGGTLSPALRAQRTLARRARIPGIALEPSPTAPYWACPESSCDAIVEPPAEAVGSGSAKAGFALPQKKGRLLEGSGVKGGLAPSDLRSAYKIPETGGETQTVALVDAYGYANAEEDLETYRHEYKLPPCTKANGCFRKVNQQGEEANYPPNSEGWDTESALDIEMVSAACPSCHILLAEADEPSGDDLSEAVATAARLGATEISNSYGSVEEECEQGEEEGCEREATVFGEHPGVLITVSAGDYGYDNATRGDGEGPNYPASLPTVVAVGGTNLYKAANARGWEDTAWSEGGSGCSSHEPKPPWQQDSGCSMRMSDDVAAVGACETPVSTYSHYGAWRLVCGTSVSSPLVAGIEAHAGAYARSLPGADAFYHDPSALFDVTKGSNGTCTPHPEHAYYCNAAPGYDGPTGNGVPDGPFELTGAPPDAATHPASTVTGASATLNGALAPQGQQASYHFEYGTSTSYGSAAPVPDGEVPAGSGSEPVTTSVSGLSPGTVYHYRLEASGPGGTSHGADEVFVTAPPATSALQPAEGPPRGETAVTITGENFDGANAVMFGSRHAASFTVTSDGTITAVSPAGTGTAAVRVITPAGESAAAPAVSFVYEALGTVLSWGRNGGALGNGRLAPAAVPGEMLEIPEAAQLAAGVWVNDALTAGGRVLAWGENPFGDVGNGSKDHEPVTSPIPVCAAGPQEPCPSGPYLEDVTQVAAGWEHSLALLASGRVVAWGGGDEGELGRGFNSGHEEPEYVCTGKEGSAPEGLCKAGDYLEEVTAVSAGGDFSLALLRNGAVMAFGRNRKDELGTPKGVGPESCGAAKETCSTVPIPVPGLEHVSAIAAGDDASLAVLQDGSVMAWGANEFGQLGDGSSSPSYAPVPVCALGEHAPCNHRLEGVESVAAGFEFALALRDDGSVVDWGDNINGSLGTGSSEGPEAECADGWGCSRSPIAVPGIGPVQRISTGVLDTSVTAVTDAGEILSWGAGAEGALGDGSYYGSPSPKRVCAAYHLGPCPQGPYLEGSVTALSAAGSHVLIGFASIRPVVGGVSPDSGPGSGGTSVTITGSRLAEVSAVHYGAAAASEFEVVSEHELRAVAPPGSGLVHIVVTTPAGTSEPSPADRFAYITAPAAVTGQASALKVESATLNATVDPDGANVTECVFQYGSGSEYGSSVPCSVLPGAGISPVAVTAQVSGLQRGSTYHFRILATNAQGTGYGEDGSFTTLSSELPELGRCTKVSGTPVGRYANKGCTTASSGEDSGEYEWHEGPGEAAGFTGAGATTTLWEINRKGKGYIDLTCASNVLLGEYRDWRTGSATLKLAGCYLPVFGTGFACQTPGVEAGQIVTALDATLVAVPHGKKTYHDLELTPPEGATLAYDCTELPNSTAKLAMVGQLAPANRMTKAFKVAFKGSDKEAGVAVKDTISNGEALEFKTSP